MTDNERRDAAYRKWWDGPPPHRTPWPTNGERMYSTRAWSAGWHARDAEVHRLRQTLLDYGRHDEGCIGAHGDEYPCTCGWRDERATLQRKERHTPPTTAEMTGSDPDLTGGLRTEAYLRRIRGGEDGGPLTGR